MSIDVTLGFFYPSQVNDFLDRQTQNKLVLSGFSAMVLQLGIGLSGYIRPTRWLSLRPNFEVYLAPKILEGAQETTYLMWALAPGFASDFIVNPRSRARFFLTVGAAYYFAGFEGDHGHGVGLDGGFGLEVFFGRARRTGITFTLTGQWANAWLTEEDKARGIDTLQFSGALLRMGPVFSFGDPVED